MALSEALEAAEQTYVSMGERHTECGCDNHEMPRMAVASRMQFVLAGARPR